MILETLFICLLIFGVCVMVYRGAVHEYQILQKDYSLDMDWSVPLSEHLPLVVRGVPKRWLGPWTKARTAQKTWSVYVTDEHGKTFQTTWNHWLQASDASTPDADTMDAIAQSLKMHMTLQNWQAEGFRQWSWLPTGCLHTPRLAVFQPGHTQGLVKTTAECTAIVSTDGAPLEMWIAHEGAIPGDDAEELLGKDPWIQTADSIPWIPDVQYIEVRLRPGNAILVPRHWYYALRSAEGATEASWLWQASFHTPISYIVSAMTGSV